MKEVPDKFCGYINIDEDVFVCSVIGHTVKLLPAHSDSKSINGSLRKLHQRKVKTPEYLLGVDEWNYEVALLRQTGFKDRISICNCTNFCAPIIIQSAGNAAGFYSQLTKDWTKFDAITFSGGNINDVYNPKLVALRRKSLDEINEYADKLDGARTIEIKPFSEYTHSTDIVIDEQRVKLTLSVSQDGREGNLNTTELGSLASIIRLEFENPQDFISIERYYRIVRSILALLIKQNNVGFSVTLHQRNNSEQFIKTAICKTNDGYEEYSIRQYHSVVPLGDIIHHLPKLIELTSSNEADAILDLLPRSNKNLSLISISNVQNLCTALEVEQKKIKGKIKGNAIIEGLRESISATIASYIGIHPEIDVYSRTTINSAFQYLDYTLKDKIFYLYNENKDIIDAIVKKWSCSEVTLDSIGDFVKLRNTKTHSGIIDWGNCSEIYTPLFALVYACFFKRVGVSESDVKRVLNRLF